MSLREKMRHQHKREGSKARSLLHRHDGHKMATIVNHVHAVRQHMTGIAKLPDTKI